MFALQDRMSLRCAPIVAALRAKLNRDTEKYLRIENFEKCLKSSWLFPGCCVAFPLFTRGAEFPDHRISVFGYGRISNPVDDRHMTAALVEPALL
ncbi:MAG: hypothetical protein ACJ8HI_07125 [Massilia sp.]|jgi:hypothetical protein